ncbi:MAG: glycosyl hydrolase [Gammaproteobacteria bacterium]|nr:MAG: glycosyl hydrolase [Gammaproteobacteria bacterium]
MQRLRLFFLGIISIFLIGCEAPLNLDLMVAEKNNFVHRSDRFQKITRNNDAIVLVGSFGTILVSNDDGVTWSRQNLKSQDTLIDVTTCPDSSFVALGLEGLIWRSEDNGKTWISYELSTNETPQTLDCAPDGKIWVAGSYTTFFSSADKGLTWKSESLDEDMIISYIKFFNASDGIATAEFGMIIKTHDGGNTWNLQPSMPNEFYPIASLFTDMNTGWVAGLGGKMFFTNDGGENWINEITNVPVPIYSLSIDSTKIYALGALGTLLVRQLDKTVAPKWLAFETDINIRTYLRASLPIENHIIVAGGSGTLVRLANSNSGSVNE